MRLRLILPSLAAAAALAAAGCGGGGGSSTATTGSVTATGAAVRPVVAAASKTAAQGSAQVRVRGTTQVAGRRFPIDGAGAFDLKARKGRFRATTGIGGRTIRVEEIVNGLTLYVRSDALPSGLTGGRSWLKVDLQRAGRAAGVDVSSLLANADPTQFLEYLRQVGDVRRVGRATVNGVQTTHYAGTVDLGKAVKPAGASAQRALRRLQQATGVDKVPVETWIGDDGLVRRARVNVDTNRAASVDVTVDFTKFGVRVDAPPPAADDVVDVSKLTGP